MILQANARRSSGRSTDWLLVWFMVLPLLSPGLTLADEGRDESMAGAAAVPHAKISEEQAEQAALKDIPGEVTDVTVENKRGRMVYVIEVVAQKDGAETDVLVDMNSCTCLAWSDEMNAVHPAGHIRKASPPKRICHTAPMLISFTPIRAGTQLVEEQIQQELFARKVQ
jgi:hypothetical protein